MPTTVFTASSGSDRFPFPTERGRTSSSSASHRSPISVESHSNTSSFGDDWTDLGDNIDPSDSASFSRHPISRRTTTEAPQPPLRRGSSRHTATTAPSEREEPRRRNSHHHSRTHRHHRSESRRVPSDESSSALATDDHPYHHGRPYAGGYRHVPPPHTHGGYPPSVVSAGPYGDPYQQGQLVHMPPTDPFGYPTGNPFSTHASPNPFAPQGAPGYFAQEPPVQHRPPPRSVYSGGSTFSSEMYYPHSVAYPGYGPVYPQVPYMYPPTTNGTPTGEPKSDATSKEIEGLKELIRKQEEERVLREKAMIARAEAEAAAAAAKKAKEEEEAKKKEEIAAASAKAKKAAEDDAAEKAKKAKEESDKKLAEAEKAKADADKKSKELEEEIKKNTPSPDSLKEPIKFKDAVHRKFSFPWGICKTWKGTEGLIKQAFQHVDVLGQHVHDGHYDLLGPDGEIILPQVWETTVRPGWEIEMHMWPLRELEKPEKHHHAASNDPFAGLGMDGLLEGLSMGQPQGKPAKGKSGKSSKSKDKRKSQIVDVPLFPPGLDPLAALLEPNAMNGGIVAVKDKPSKSKSKKKQELPWMLRMMGAGPPPKKK